ncbi:MAG: lamin tail domain-containing protein [Deltaproteobacteria bacterium]|nr:lamin tail domain-containing protein [Deltaproteobacteria bacterium]
MKASVLAPLMVLFAVLTWSLPAQAGKPGETGKPTKDFCGNDVAGKKEQCDGADLKGTTCVDLGFTGGDLACDGECDFDTSSCTMDPVCGDDVAEPPEACDGSDLAGLDCLDFGFDGGTLDCDGACAYDTSGCTTAPVCGDGLAEAPEECDGSDLAGLDCLDLGFDGGVLGCDGTCAYDISACTADPVCGDGVAEGTEQCDGADLADTTCETLGYPGGTLACDGACAFDESGCLTEVCGNGEIEGSEQCDGSNLGGLTCGDFGYDGGTLGCDAGCGYDFSACSTNDPFCGNDLVDGAYEECDGVDDAACPGACSAYCACPATAALGDMEVHAIDVGQGDAILVVSPDGFVMLVDSGTGAQAAVISAYMASIGVSSVDYTVVTHLHADHIGGMDGILATYPEVVVAFDHGGTSTTTEYLDYEAAAGARRQTVQTAQTLDLGPSVTAEVLHAYGGSANENDNSVVIKLTHGNLTYLIGGDCEAPCESAFDPGHIDVYKVHHHGADDATSEDLLQQMTPRTALISVGANNSYGHPDQVVLDRLATHGVDVWRTDLDGDLEVIGTSTSYTVNGVGTCTNGQTRSCGVSDVGACEFGIETCTAGTWGVCEGEVGPALEECTNGIDDDCDGDTDGFDSECATGPGHPLLAQAAYDTPGTDSIEEFVDLYNPTDSAVSLDGWTLSDNVKTWSFSAGATIAPHTYLSVARNAAGFEALYGLVPDLSGLTTALNNTGDVLILRDGASAEVDRVAWENFEPGWSITAATGDAIERLNPTVDTDAVEDWSVTSPAQPRGGSLK